MIVRRAIDSLRGFFRRPPTEGGRRAEILAAILDRDDRRFDEALRGGYDVSLKGGYPGGSLAGMAARFGYSRMVERLLEEGAGARGENGDDLPPLVMAADADPSLGHPDESARIAEILVRAGADPDSEDSSGRSALLLAAASGKVGMTRVLLEAGADPDRPTPSGVAPMDVATPECADLLRWFAGRRAASEEREELAVEVGVTMECFSPEPTADSAPTLRFRRRI